MINHKEVINSNCNKLSKKKKTQQKQKHTSKFEA